MSFPPPGRHSGAAHHEYCNTGLCCRCQMRTWTTKAGNERLCGPCAACCQECGRAPAPHLDGLDGGLCAECRGLCERCHAPRRPDGSCACDRWRENAKSNPRGYVLQALPQQLLQALGGRVPSTVHDLIHDELGRNRSAGLLRERIERRWKS
ncbi:Transcriptional regulator OS=Streptomyces cyaneofuscatus OX=66883 GN=G3I52_08620 PE=4 SV=1 [Streptomyces cyaneofuscatus]